EAEHAQEAAGERAAGDLETLRAELKAATARWLEQRAVRAELSRVARRLDDARLELDRAQKDRNFARVAGLEHQLIPALEGELEQVRARLDEPSQAAPEVSEAAVAQVI